MIDCKIERRLPCPIGRLFQLVGDIEAYPRYMPGWRSVRVVSRKPGRTVVEQIVSLGAVRIQFRSTADDTPPRRIEIYSTDAPFRSARLSWQFTAATPMETIIRDELALAFRSRMLERFLAPLVPIVLVRAIAAFERRAANASV